MSGDKSKTLTCAVKATNSAAPSGVIATAAATSAVTDPTELTLAQVRVRLIAAEAAIATLRSDTNAVTERTDAQDVAIEAMQTGFGDRISNLETDTGGLRERVDALEATQNDQQVVTTEAFEAINTTIDAHGTELLDLQERMDGVASVVNRFATNGRVRVRLS